MLIPANAADTLVANPNKLDDIPAIIGVIRPAIAANAAGIFETAATTVPALDAIRSKPAVIPPAFRRSIPPRSTNFCLRPSTTFPTASQVLTVPSRLRLLSTICCNHCTAPFKLSENPLTPFKTGPVNISPNTSLTENKRCPIKSH